jgi:protein-S-isoprenylcysteine O-methyltransferase Ste14
MTYDLAQLVVIVTVWVYWACVLALIVRSNFAYRTPAGGVPQLSHERWLWAGFVPLIAFWLLLPIVAGWGWPGLVAIPHVFLGNPVFRVVRTIAAGAGVLALLLTLPCWLGMGRSWSIAVVPKKRTELITRGMFARVRHPIYALNLLLMISTALVVPSAAMITTGVVHALLIYHKTLGEEAYLHQAHGQRYADYCRQTGRYLPRMVVDAPSQPAPRKAA